MQKQFSIIIPIYNRPDEMEELLSSLALQSVQNFEIIVVEDGSTLPCKNVVALYNNKLDIKYFVKENSGPGRSRNYGIQQSTTDFFIFFDSDCLIPEHYMQSLSEKFANQQIDCYGGPDKAHHSFSPIQKAISYSMTAMLTTGGIRGASENIEKFHPRSFNMGFSRKVFEATGGFGSMRFGEDVDFSIRVEKSGFKCRLLSACYVYHKRRTDFGKFYKQIYNSGIARINLAIDHPHSLKLTHFFPTAFVIGSLAAVTLLSIPLFFPVIFLIIYCVALFIDACWKYKSLHIGGLALAATWVQMYAYGLGFLQAFWNRMILKRATFEAFNKNFYK